MFLTRWSSVRLSNRERDRAQVLTRLAQLYIFCESSICLFLFFCTLVQWKSLPDSQAKMLTLRQFVWVL